MSNRRPPRRPQGLCEGRVRHGGDVPPPAPGVLIYSASVKICAIFFVPSIGRDEESLPS